MKLDWALLANYAEVRDGLAFVTGGGIDTIQTPQLPAVLNATILVRLFCIAPRPTSNTRSISRSPTRTATPSPKSRPVSWSP